MHVIGAKILGGFLFMLLALVFGWMPYFCLRRRFVATKSVLAQRAERRRPVVIQCLHSLASGVMLATCLLHLLPESLDAVRTALSPESDQHTRSLEVSNITLLDLASRGDGQSQGAGHRFPVAECLVAMGFLLIYIIDSFIRSCSKSRDSGKYFHLTQGQDDPTDSRASLLSSHESNMQTEGNWRSSPHLTNPSLQLRWIRPKFSEARETVPRDASECQVEDGALIESDLEGDRHESINLRGQLDPESDNSASGTASISVEAHPRAALRGPEESGQSSRLRSVTLVSALCIHGFFDGVMLGLQTSLPVVTSLLLALSIHKSFVAVGLSLTLLASSHDKKVSDCSVLLYVFLFASVAPLGLVVSAAFLHRTFEASSDSEAGLVPGCLQSFAVGTFLYVTLSGLTEREGHGRGFASLAVSHLFLLVGFILMATLRAYLGST